MSKKYGIMLIGCGHIGEAHMSDIYYRDNVNIVAVIDDSIEKAKLFAKKYNASYCDNKVSTASSYSFLVCVMLSTTSALNSE